MGHKYYIEAVAHSSAAHIPAAPLAVEIDSRRIGLMEVVGAPSARGWLTPTLAAGRHLIRLENQNVTLRVNLEILAVEIHFHEGSAPGSEAFPAWLAAFHATCNSVADAPLASPVSPLCLEGIARHPFQVSVATVHTIIAAAEGLTGQWYADVPLDPFQPAALTVSFENGELPAIDRRLELAADPALALREMATHEDSPREVEFTLATHSPADPRVTARLPGGGPIAAATAIPAFPVVDSARTLDAHVVNILSDGTRVVEIGILIEGPIPPDLLLTIGAEHGKCYHARTDPIPEP